MLIIRPPIRYYGGKWRLAPWIISHFPLHQCYVEPFGGAAGVLLRKPPSVFEIFNDIDHEVVNFFRVLRERPVELIRAIELTPWSREEQRLSFEPCDDPLERARRFYLRSWQTRGGPRTQWRSGWRYHYRINGQRPPDTTKLWNQTDHLWAVVERLKQVQIECDDALAVIERYDAPTTLFYVDPPYLAETRSQRWSAKAYQHEMSREDHIRLAEVLNEVEGMVVLSGYPSDLYEELYGEWETRIRGAVNEVATKTVERIWISPNALRAVSQPALFTEPLR